MEETTTKKTSQSLFKAKTTVRKIIADTITPVSIYLKIRDQYPGSFLLESSDYRGQENSFSYVCFNSVANITLEGKTISMQFPDGSKEQEEVKVASTVTETLSSFAKRFQADDQDYGFISNGMFGYIAYDAVQYFEDVEITKDIGEEGVPDVVYHVFQNIIAINHFKNEAYLIHHSFDGTPENLSHVEQLLSAKNFPSFHFEALSDEQSNFTDTQFLEVIDQAKKHCYRGDVFQLVLSRKFNQSFKGDEFNVYRALRSVNPSPYLFYFDFGSYKIFGSSPEAQLIVKGEKATIHPIAGTFKRTGNDKSDAAAAERLAEDPKENAEHVMLVDLARNDLSRNGSDVHVETYKEIQFFSHVIHLVSKVTAIKDQGVETMNLVADTFPAGTLSGAPKHKALQLIERYEKENRGVYGGCIGFMDFAGDFNSAIVIRSFLSKDNKLHYQAGAGIVAHSDTESELQEVHNKLGALRKAIEIGMEL